MIDGHMLGHRYRLLAQVGKGGMGQVYRALDCLTGQHVALKQVSRSSEPGDSTHSSTVYYALAEEFKVLASLRHPHIISVLDYGFDHNREPYFTLELLEQAQSFVAYAEDRSLNQQVELTIQLLQALTYLHQRGIIHRDLKPSNVMVIDHQVKVLDFGLALARQYLGANSERVGTLFYMAPETFAGASVSVASDLYAVGVMLYQMLTGQMPFSSESSKYALMYKIARSTPDYSPLEAHPLRPIVERLLQKDPSQRYDSADDLITAFCDAVNYPPPTESIAVRESFLQAAHFVGREHELNLLRDALTQSYRGQGSSWLIGGESGVGKSRLLEELRTQALVNGAIVLRGQAIAEGSLPYQMWREAIRRLTLQTPLTDFNAAVLKPLVPDISTLLGRPIPDSPLIDAESLQVRLLAVIEDLFRQQQQPIVMLLEDLQWADDSLLLLKRLEELTRTSSLIIIGTYRDDERPSLADELPMLKHIKLERLSADSIEALSVSMLGDVGKSKAVIDLLKRETEGNAFFIVEVVRTLAEEAGQRSDIGRKTLPEQVFAGGIEAIVARRLARVPAANRRLITIAAVAGRDLDLKVLHGIMPSVNTQVWLQQVGAVIEVLVGDRYRFAHDKLREGLLRPLTPPDRQQMHQEIACAIELVYPDSPEQFAALAYHWDQAHDAAKTIQYAMLAGQQTLGAGNYREAVQFFHQALAWTQQAGSDKQLLGQLYYLIGDAYWGQSDMLHSREAQMKVLETLGYSVPVDRRQLILRALKPLFGHLWRHVFGIRRQASHYEELLLVARAYFQILQGSYHDANFSLGFYCIFSGIDASERAGDVPEAIGLQARNYLSLGFAMGDMGRHRIADFYIRHAEQRVKGYDDLQTRAWLDFVYGIYLAGRGQWERVNSLLDKSVQLSAEAGSVRLWGEASEFKVYILSLQNRFADALITLEGAAHVAIRDEHIQAIGRTQITKASLLLYQGKTEEARNQYFSHEAVIKTSFTLGDQTISKIFASGFLIDLAVRDEDWEKALILADTLNAQVRGAQTVSFLLARAASASVLLYLTLWEREKKETYKSSAQTALALFHRKYTRFFEIGQPIDLMYRCWYSWLNGQEKQARAIGIQAIHAAQTYKMPYYEAAARYHLARFMPKDDPDRADHLTVALQLFDQVGAAYDAEVVRLLLLADSMVVPGSFRPVVRG